MALSVAVAPVDTRVLFGTRGPALPETVFQDPAHADARLFVMPHSGVGA